MTLPRERFARLLIAVVTLTAGCADPVERVPPWAGRTRSSGLARGCVASYHAASTAAGVAMLAAGGNAFDAFVAATFMDYVVTSGASSPAGPLDAILYVSAEDKILEVDGALQNVLDPDGGWTGNEAERGKAFEVPGAVAALTELHARHGRLPRAQVLAPAIEQARRGFVIDPFYEAGLTFRPEVLGASAYGRRTFFSGDRPLAVGDMVRLPELADFLDGIARQGAAYMYTGPWTQMVVETVAQLGGRLTLADLARYQPTWKEPAHTIYRGFDVHAPSGRSNGGVWAMAALKILEHTELRPLGHYGDSADALELMVKTVRALDEDGWYYDRAVLDDASAVSRHFDEPYTGQVWARVMRGLGASPTPTPGSHSFHVVTCDADGNVVSGTNTIEGLAFGDGVFVQGVPLNAAGRLTVYDTAPGERRLSPFSEHLVFRGGRLKAAAGAFGSSLFEAELELLVDLIDYGRSGPEAAASKRFGTFPNDPRQGTVDTTRNWLDPRVSPALVEIERARGLSFVQDATADTGFGVALTVDDAGEPWAGALPEWHYPVSVEVYPRR